MTDKLTIGTYTLSEFKDNTQTKHLWLAHDGGEGMQVSAEMIDKFFKENF